jgi:hypothetical protein
MTSYKRGDIIRNVGSGKTYVVVDIVGGNVIEDTKKTRA